MEAVAPSLRIAVVGAGIAGITAAYLLGKRHEVTLIERNDYIGGHTNTITVQEDGGDALSVDTGFIVCNPSNYPRFYRLLDEWEVPRRDSEMSFGYYCERTRLGYVGPSMREFLRRSSNLLNPSFLRLLIEQRRFNRRASVDLASGALNGQTLGEYLQELGVKPIFIEHYLLPLAAAVWSSPDSNMLDFPAQTFVRFFANHGMLELRRRPTWQTVVGGSHAYIKAFRNRFRGRVMVNAPVQSVNRQPDGVHVKLSGGALRFDRVVLAAHADQSLAMLADASEAERSRLSAWKYHRNATILHTDNTIMPRDRRLWASWNYTRRANRSSTAPISVTYYMNRLQGLQTKRDYLVSLNAGDAIDPESIIYSVDYSHPAYTGCSIKAQAEIRAHNGQDRTYFCGSYMGYGFHEDAVSSAADVASELGAAL